MKADRGASNRSTLTSPREETAASPPRAMKDRARQTDRAVLLALLGKMLLIRRFEERTADLYRKGKIGGFCHLYAGQEAVAVGAISALAPKDYIFTSYRDHGHALARGVDPGEVMAELYGKDGGLSKGKGGSMHLFDKEHGLLGGYAVVGEQIPIAVGAAFAAKYLKDSRVAVCFFGEAAVNISAFHEALNLAALWKLPVVFVCENNRYGMGTPVERASALYDLAHKACAYQMERSIVDGMDVLAVREEALQAVERARDKSLPTLIEARTYRFYGHSMSDPEHGHYRTQKEVEEQKLRDPISLLASTLRELGIVSEREVDDLEEKGSEAVEDAVAFAEESLETPSTELKTDVYD
jgi:pyruvate dehydrogenase E1 component alpha subunit